MQKKIIIALMMSIALLLSACDSNTESNNGEANGNRQTESPPQEQVGADAISPSESNILIAYFAYSENIGDTSGMDVDAITSASLNAHTDNAEGNLQVMAQEAAEVKGGDLFPIQISEPYDSNYDTMVGVAQDDQKNATQFTFINDISNFNQYDVIYIGVPVWWGKLPQPMVSFFETYDFTGKTIIPFGIHLGSRFGSMINEMKELEPDADVQDGFTISADTDNEDVRAEFDEFLDKLD